SPGVTLAQETHVVRRDRGGQGATRLEIGNQDGLVGAEELGGFGHEVDAGQDDHFGVGPGGGSGERERVAGEVGDAVEYLRRLVVVRQYDRAPLGLERVDRGDVGRVDRPFDLGNDAPHALVDRSSGARDLRGEVERRRRAGVCHGSSSYYAHNEYSIPQEKTAGRAGSGAALEGSPLC